MRGQKENARSVRSPQATRIDRVAGDMNVERVRTLQRGNGCLNPEEAEVRKARWGLP